VPEGALLTSIQIPLSPSDQWSVSTSQCNPLQRTNLRLQKTLHPDFKHKRVSQKC
jgi:hypothetical protein